MPNAEEGERWGVRGRVTEGEEEEMGRGKLAHDLLMTCLGLT